MLSSTFVDRPRLAIVIAIVTTASGASELARRGVGTPVFGGMLFASFLGIFAIPPLYVTFQWIAERLSTRKPETLAAQEIKSATSSERFSTGPAE